MKNYIKLLAAAILFITTAQLHAQERYTMSGYLKDKKTGETLIGATIYIKEIKHGVVTNPYGFFSISLPKGEYSVDFTFVGYDKLSQRVKLTSNTTLNAELESSSVQLESVVVSSKKKDENVSRTQLGMAKIDSKKLSSLPVLMGESDIMKSIQLMPGVQAPVEGSSGFTVRGGSSDQNLILLDEAPVYNASHLLGFFSVFNTDAIKDATLYKGDIPAAHGGRLSSLLDIRMKDGNSKDYHLSGGIGLISSRLTVEGPIKKDKGSFIVSARRTYADMFLALSSDSSIRKNKLYFYDVNVKGNYTINDNNRVFVSAYFGRDVTGYGNDFSMKWGNATLTTRWNHVFNSRLFSNFTVIYSNYQYNLENSDTKPEFKWRSNLQDIGFKYDFSFYQGTSNTIKFGVSSTLHYIEPGKVTVDGKSSSFNATDKRAVENGVYVSNEQKIGDKLTLNYGLRFSSFHNFGPATVYVVDKNKGFAVTDTITYGKNNFYNSSFGFEPRFSANYRINDNSSVKAAYSRTRQYLQLASNSSAGSPLDIWFPASQYVEPQISDQVGVGYFRNFMDNSLEFSVEGFYKWMQNQIDFKDNADLLLNDQLEKELRFGKARSYGVEFFVRKNTGNLTGWVSYTLSKAIRKFPDINAGKSYNANYDHPNNLNVVLTYKISPRTDFTASWVYYSGTPITYPAMRFNYGNSNLPYYEPGTKNSWRLPDYHRLDLSLTVRNKRKPGQRWESEWNFAVYNAYNRANAYSVYFETDKNDSKKINTYKMVMFPIIPSVTYNFKF
ncbi:TonB-dependent receptor [Alistipes sp. ZOR0009]|uniref:TonB-dependent receptor n=1 Tax=Alistipes sp. ZOR0009 TaxID=1339253 RepID=UPI000646293A|nr:TonB-dependent receptor [Alistipes sp. ZOR0009]